MIANGSAGDDAFTIKAHGGLFSTSLPSPSPALPKKTFQFFKRLSKSPSLKINAVSEQPAVFSDDTIIENSKKKKRLSLAVLKHKFTGNNKKRKQKTKNIRSSTPPDTSNLFPGLSVVVPIEEEEENVAQPADSPSQRVMKAAGHAYSSCKLALSSCVPYFSLYHHPASSPEESTAAKMKKKKKITLRRFPWRRMKKQPPSPKEIMDDAMDKVMSAFRSYKKERKGPKLWWKRAERWVKK